MEVILTRDSEIKGRQSATAPLGFSWTCFFFSAWVPLLRKDWKWFFIMIGSLFGGAFLLGVMFWEMGEALAGIYGFVLGLFFDFKYNEFSLVSRLEAGFRPVDSHAVSLIKTKYPEVAYRFKLGEEA